MKESNDGHVEDTPPCEFHDHDTEACEKYSGSIPCTPKRPKTTEQYERASRFHTFESPGNV